MTATDPALSEAREITASLWSYTHSAFGSATRRVRRALEEGQADLTDPGQGWAVAMILSDLSWADSEAAAAARGIRSRRKDPSWPAHYATYALGRCRDHLDSALQAAAGQPVAGDITGIRGTMVAMPIADLAQLVLEAQARVDALISDEWRQTRADEDAEWWGRCAQCGRVFYPEQGNDHCEDCWTCWEHDPQGHTA